MHPDQQYADQPIICHDCHEIVYRRDQRTGSDRRIDFDLVEKHRDDRTDQARNDHRQKQRQTHTTGNRKGISVIQSFCKVQLKAYTYKRQCAKQKSVCSAYPHFL